MADTGHYGLSVSALTDRRQEGDISFLVEVGRDASGEDEAVRRTHPPRIVPNVLDSQPVVNGSTRLEGGPRTIPLDDLDELLSAVANPDASRPGIRGIKMDRGALAGLLAKEGSGELYARVLRIGDLGTGSSIHWYSADPVPLDELLAGGARFLIDDLLKADDLVAQRLRVAARWYAAAFWASSEVDSALAVFVALDALLTGKEAVSGAVSKGRFALLERGPTQRESRLDRYEKVCRVRNTIVHGGGTSKSLAQVGGSQSLLADARWVAARLVELRELLRPNSDADLRAAWNGIQWGTVSWVIEQQAP